MAGDPLLPNDWHEDPWDEVSVVSEGATEELVPGFDSLRRPVRMIVSIVIATILLIGSAGWWVVHQLNPAGEPGASVNFTVNDGDTLSSVSGRLADQNIINELIHFPLVTHQRVVASISCRGITHCVQATMRLHYQGVVDSSCSNLCFGHFP